MSCNQSGEKLTEIELPAHCKILGSVHKINQDEDEMWLLQCPKGMKLGELVEQEQMKLPGRTTVRGQELVASEFLEGSRSEAFSYYRPRKQKYSVQILPIRGTIVVRDRLQLHKDFPMAARAPRAFGQEILGGEEMECSGQGYMNQLPNPDEIPLRHPLLGYQFKDSLERIKPSALKRLVQAEVRSAKILKRTLRGVFGVRKTKASISKRLLRRVKREPARDSDVE